MEGADKLLWSVQVDHQLFALEKLDVTVSLNANRFGKRLLGDGECGITWRPAFASSPNSMKEGILGLSHTLLESPVIKRNGGCTTAPKHCTQSPGGQGPWQLLWPHKSSIMLCSLSFFSEHFVAALVLLLGLVFPQTVMMQKKWDREKISNPLEGPSISGAASLGNHV